MVLQTHEAMSEAVVNLRRRMQQLYDAPRIHDPLWLTLVAVPQRRVDVCQRLYAHGPGRAAHAKRVARSIDVLVLPRPVRPRGGGGARRRKRLHELDWLLSACESRRTGFFVSTALTAVLANHLAWVTTVTPAGVVGVATPSAAAGADANAVFQAQFPYNPLWAQLTDLYGAVATPTEMARTVVCGRNAAVVRRLLFVLTYFIRSVRQAGGRARTPHELCVPTQTAHTAPPSTLDGRGRNADAVTWWKTQSAGWKWHRKPAAQRTRAAWSRRSRTVRAAPPWTRLAFV